MSLEWHQELFRFIQDVDWKNSAVFLQCRPGIEELRELEALALQPSSSEPTPEGSTSDDAARMRVERALDKLRTLRGRRGSTSKSAAMVAVLESQASAPLPAGLAVVVQRAAVTSTVTAGGVAGIFNVITTSTVTTMIAGVICLLSIGTALHQNRQVRAAQAALHAADDVAQGRIPDLQARLAAAEKPRAAAEATSAENHHHRCRPGTVQRPTEATKERRATFVVQPVDARRVRVRRGCRHRSLEEGTALCLTAPT